MSSGEKAIARLWADIDTIKGIENYEALKDAIEAEAAPTTAGEHSLSWELELEDIDFLPQETTWFRNTNS